MSNPSNDEEDIQLMRAASLAQAKLILLRMERQFLRLRIEFYIQVLTGKWSAIDPKDLPAVMEKDLREAAEMGAAPDPAPGDDPRSGKRSLPAAKNQS